MDHKSPSLVSGSLQVSEIRPLPPVFTYQSHYNSCSHIQLMEDDQVTDHSECRIQVEKQYKLKMDSLTRQYEVKLAKERETYELRSKNYEEEIFNLKKQIRQTNPAKNGRKEDSQMCCSICSNGQIITHMKNMLESLEDSHKLCLSQKKHLNDQICTLEQQISILEDECNLAQEKYKKSRQQIRQLKQQKDQAERQKRQKDKTYKEKQKIYQTKQIELQQELSRVKMLEKQIQKQFRNIKKSKVKTSMNEQLEDQQISNTSIFRKSFDSKDKPSYKGQANSHQLNRNLPYLQSRDLNEPYLRPNYQATMNEYSDYGQFKKRNRVREENYHENMNFETFRPYGKFSYFD